MLYQAEPLPDFAADAVELRRVPRRNCWTIKQLRTMHYSISTRASWTLPYCWGELIEREAEDGRQVTLGPSRAFAYVNVHPYMGWVLSSRAANLARLEIVLATNTNLETRATERW